MQIRCLVDVPLLGWGLVPEPHDKLFCKKGDIYNIKRVIQGAGRPYALIEDHRFALDFCAEFITENELTIFNCPTLGPHFEIIKEEL